MSQPTAESLTFDDEAEQRTTLIAFGHRLRATREAAEVSQSTLDARCFLPDGAVYKLEHGCKSVPGLILILRLAAGLTVDPGILLDGLPVPQRTEGEAVAVIAFGDRLRATRKAAGLSQTTLAARCFLKDGAVSKLERGCRSAPGLILILQLAAGLTVDPGILLDGLPVPQRTGGIRQAAAMIAENPGIRIATLEDKMGLPTSYVLRLIRWLSGYGVISRYQRGWAVVRMDAPDGARVRSAPNREVGRRVSTPS